MNRRIFIDLALGSTFVFVTFFMSLRDPDQIRSAAASHIVISEVKLAGETTLDEFIELYNPTNQIIDLAGWRLTRKTATGTENNLVSNLSGLIPAKGYFLISHPQNMVINPDQVYSASSSAIAINNTVLLYSDAGLTVVDKVGMGTASDVETQAASNPSTGQSIERKAKATSTQESMIGADAMLGNSEDSDNNSNDFVLSQSPQPQNKSAASESLLQPSASPTPTSIPTPSVSPSPVVTPSSTPVPTTVPTSTPTSIPSPSPSSTPLPTPVASPAMTPQPSAMPSIEPTPSPNPRKILICSWQVKVTETRFFTLRMPRLMCTRQ